MTESYTYAKGTKVPVNQSRGDIEKLLKRVGADAIGFMADNLTSKIAFRLGGRHYVLALPNPPAGAKAEQREREQWRQLLLLLKAKIVAVDSGIVTAAEEFLPYAMLPTGQTLSEHVFEHPDVLTTSGVLMLPGGDA